MPRVEDSNVNVVDHCQKLEFTEVARAQRTAAGDVLGRPFARSKSTLGAPCASRRLRT